MPKFTADIPTPAANLSITSPVEDKTTAAAIKALGTLGIEARRGSLLAEQENQVETEIQDYLAKKTVEDDLPAAAEMFTQLSEQTGDTFFEDPLVREAQGRVRTLERAAQAGAINSNELKARIELITQGYITRSPGLAPEFRNVSKSALGDVATTTKLLSEAEDAAAKGKTDRIKMIYQQAKEQNLDLQEPFEVLAVKVTKNNEKLRAVTELQNNVALSEGDNTLQANLVREQFPNYLTGQTLATRAKLENILASPDMNPAEKVIEMQNLATNLSIETKSFSAIVGGDVKTKAAGTLLTASDIDNMSAPLITMVENYKERALGTIDQEALQTKNTIDLAVTEGQLLRNPNTRKAIVMMQKAPGIVRDLAGEANGVSLLTNIIDAFNASFNNRPPPTPRIPNPEAEAKERENYHKVVDKIVDDKEVEIGDKQKLLKGAFIAYDPERFTNEEYTAIIENMANDKYIDVVSSDPELKVNLDVAFADFLDKRLYVKMGEEIHNIISKGSQYSTPFVSFSNYITTNIDGNGNLAFTTTNRYGELDAGERALFDRDLARLNRTYAKRFNNTVKAASHIQGHKDYKQQSEFMWDIFSTQYAFELGNVEEAPRNVRRLNSTIPPTIREGRNEAGGQSIRLDIPPTGAATPALTPEIAQTIISAETVEEKVKLLKDLGVDEETIKSITKGRTE